MGFKLNKDYYPVAFLALIGAAAYILYSGVLTPKIDLQQYKAVCTRYRTAAAGTYSNKQIQSLITKVNYLFPENLAYIKDPEIKEIKKCAMDLEASLKNKK